MRRCTGIVGLEGGGGGGGDLTVRKNTQCPKARVLFERNQIAVKTKMFTILTSNENVVIRPKIAILKHRILYGLVHTKNGLVWTGPMTSIDS